MNTGAKIGIGLGILTAIGATAAAVASTSGAKKPQTRGLQGARGLNKLRGKFAGGCGCGR